MLISPIVLVRLLTVEEFGRYREFLLYTTVLLNFAAFGINNSLLRFVPGAPELKWRFVQQTSLMTLASSVLVTGGALLLDTFSGGKVLGEFALATVLYVLLFVNLDFWEFLWLAEKRSYAVLGYTTGRLIARMATVITAAAITREVAAVVWSLVCLEAVRLTVSLMGWLRRAQPAPGEAADSWREQLKYCLPFGGSLVMNTLNRSMASLFVAKMLGPVALAHYAIGTYVQPVIAVLRNSLSDVLLPEMVSRDRAGHAEDRLELFRRTTVVITIFLVASGVVLARFAEMLVITLFSEQYRPAVFIFQLYLLVFARESLDFGVPLRAINRTAPILHSNLLAIILNVVLLLVMLPAFGLIGAVAAFLVSRVIEGAYLGWQTMLAYEASPGQLAPWLDLGKVLVAAGLAALVLYGDFWTTQLGFAGVFLGAAAYAAAFAVLLILLRVPEARALLQYVRSAPATILRRPE